MDKPNFGNSLPANQKGWLLNLFNLAVRDGEKEPNQIIFNVRRRIKKYLDDPYIALERATVLKELTVLLNTSESLEYAKYVLGYESLPPSERQAIKTSRTEEYKKAVLSEQPPTEKQLWYLKKLGYQGEVNNKKHASEIIDQLVKKSA